ncbi:MAG: AAA family ATPase, partial [Actinomycetota bacterium]|nr:AAA family ATPase [Actinomycetota bacterium]
MEHAVGNGWASDAAQAAPLLERGRPLERADALLASAREGHGYVLGLEGPAGIGKTRLLDAVVNRAPDFDVLRATGAPFEREFEFGLVRDLFEGQGDELAFGPRGRLSPAECGDRVRELFGFAYTRASMRPVLVAIDDLHWADEHSLRFLAYLGTHVASLPIAVVLSWRPAALSSAPIADLLETIEDRHTLAPLSEAATAELLELARAGYGRAATCCHAATAGNPWLVVESCRALVDDARSDPEPLERVIDALTPRAVASTVTLRIQALGAEAVSFAQAVAILGEDARMRLAAALGGLDLAAAACASELLTRADLMAPTSPLRFSAPIVRNAVYGSIAPSQRSLLHGEAAWLIAGAGATQDAVADHLLLSEPADDPETVAVLQATAGRALAAGSALRAARYLERALAEPPPAGARHGVLLELGALEARMCLAGAESHLVEVLEAGSLQAGSGGALRARAALELADLRLLTGRFKESLCDSQLPKCDEEAALRAELAFCSIAANDPLPSGWWRAELASSGDETPDERAWTAAAVCAATLDGEPVSLTLPAAERAFAAGM